MVLAALLLWRVDVGADEVQAVQRELPKPTGCKFSYREVAEEEEVAALPISTVD